MAQLEDRLRANSSNSSTAPSSNPAWASSLKARKPTGKKPGGQKGHKGHYRQLLPPEDVDEVVEHRPAVCTYCQVPLTPTGEDQLLSRHQVAELPRRAVRITEHQAYACCCGACGHRTAASIPPLIQTRCTGPRLDAALCYMSAFVHGSRRAIEDLAAELFGIPLSLGTLISREKEMTQALGPAYEAIQKHVRQAPAKHVDETGWKRAGRWLWVAVTQEAALFHIDRGRNWHGLQNLLGELVCGTVCSDRFGVYDHLKTTCRAVCWAHLKRDFQRWVDRGGSTSHLGEEGLKITGELFDGFRRFRQGQIKRPRLTRLLGPLKQRLKTLLAWGEASGVKKAVAFCRHLKRLGEALWTFARVEGIEPTNNLAERMLRPAVIWRKKSFGSHSPGGCRYVERMLSVIQTLKLSGKPLMPHLSQTLHAHRHHLQTPSPF